MNAADTAVENWEADRAGTGLLFWPIALLAGVLIYELTDQPGLGAAAACLKFGLEDWQTGWWLWRRDPRAERGRACGWLYLAGGLWKVAASAVAVLFLAAVVEEMGRPGLGGLPPALAASLILALGGFTLAAGATLMAFVTAGANDLKLWLSWRIRRDRRADRWPPTSMKSAGDNSAGVLLISTAIIGSVVAAAVGGLVLPQLAPFVAVPLIVLLLLGPAAAMIVFRRRGYAGILAASPHECWGD